MTKKILYREIYRQKRSYLALLMAALMTVPLAGCGIEARLRDIGEVPKLTPIVNPVKTPGYQPVSIPLPQPVINRDAAGSLWQPGERSFFKDEKADKVGDILTILVNITDTASLKGTTNANTSSSNSMGIPDLFGITGHLPTPINPASLLSASGSSTFTGQGTIQRNAVLTLSLAGIITQVFPNGNMVVVANQELLINNQLRVLSVSGILRPQDISPDNTIQVDRLADARISYGGIGLLTRMEREPYGQQILNAVMPF